MTKEELKAKLASDPDARKKFITATADYYKSIGLSAAQQDIATLSDNLEKAVKAGPKMPFPIIIIVIIPYPPERGRV